MQEILKPCFEWVLQRQEKMVEETTKVGIVNNCLAYLHNCATRGHFAYGLMLGLGANFRHTLRKEFFSLVV
jgi:hypothetical protein